MRVYDLRSDTVTQPTPGMRAAMMAADVDDDAYADDRRVGALEARLAALLGKPAAIWLPTGTMANQIAVALHCARASALACVPGAHVRIHEDASAAALSGVQIMPIGGRFGFDVDALEALLDEEACGWPPVSLVWLENTLGEAGGAIWPLRPDAPRPDGVDAIATVAAAARARDKALHLDGARLWNAAVATGRREADLAAPFDLVAVSLSKGLGAPGGSLLAGPRKTIEAAIRYRRMFGGAMRQSGIYAAAGLYALDQNVARLADDHANARRFAERLAASPRVALDLATVQTNIVVFGLREGAPDGAAVVAAARERGVLVFAFGPRTIRAVTHLDVTREQCDEAARALAEIVESA